MKYLALIAITFQALSSLAVYPIRISCKGKNFKLEMTGLESANPATRKTVFNATVNINAKISTGAVVIRNLKYEDGLKVNFGNLVQYNFLINAANYKSAVQKGNFDMLAVAINNRTDAVATFFDKNLNTEELPITCSGVK